MVTPTDKLARTTPTQPRPDVQPAQAPVAQQPATEPQPVAQKDAYVEGGNRPAPVPLTDNRAVTTPLPSASPAQLFGIGEKNDRQKLIEATADLRARTADVKRLQTELSKIPKSDPRYPQVEAQLKAAAGALQSKYGYSADALPKPGQIWVDPQFLGKELVDGKVTASHFPIGTPVTEPPDPMSAVVKGGAPFQLLTGKGDETLKIQSAEQYRAMVAANRAAAGMPRTDGEPIGVHVSFQGGGGKGKRYAAAVSEMISQGVVPTSASGSSAGAIAAALVAAGADPAQIQKIVTDPALSKFYDIDLGDVHGGAMDGNKAYEFFDQKLRELTGITDRPVTFADLKMPLQILAAKMSDSQWPQGSDPTQVKDRIFVFSQETTPDTPVALAMRASMAIPAVFDPVQMVDPMTGREMQLTDGGVLDNLPIGYNPNKLPVVGISLGSPEDNNPAGKTAQPKSMPAGNINADNIVLNGYWGYKMNKDSATNVDDWRNRTQPQPGQFMLTVPTWNLENPKEGDSTMGFGWDAKVDPILDKQTRQVTQNWLRNVLGDMGKPGASGTNLYTKVPDNYSFNVEVKARGGRTYVATYSGGDKVHFQQKGGKDKFDVQLGKNKIDSMYLDHMAFGDLAPKLGKAADDSWSWWDQIRSGHLPHIELPKLPVAANAAA